MPKFSVMIVREVETTETVTREIEAATSQEAFALASAMANQFDRECPDDATESDGAHFGEWWADSESVALIDDRATCPRCGSTDQDGSDICPHCGEAFEVPTAQPVAPTGDALAALRALVRQIVETSAYDDAKRGEDPGLLADVANAQAILAAIDGKPSDLAGACEGFTCQACERPEIDCCADPCAAVIEAREE